MRTKLNCPSCGAAISDEKCPYCGAVFYDFSAITINEPCYIKIKCKSVEKTFLIRAKVIPKEMSVTIRPHYDEYGHYDGKTLHRISHNEGEIEMRFMMVENLGEELYTIENVEEGKK